jgi:hypothetical protein
VRPADVQEAVRERRLLGWRTRPTCAWGRGTLVPVSEIDEQTDARVGEWLHLPEAAERLDTDVSRVRQMVRERQLLAVRRGPERTLQVPAQFIHEGKLLKGLPGTLTLLSDSGYDETEALRWLFTPDDSLPGTPVDALRDNRGTEVKRRAQALGF